MTRTEAIAQAIREELMAMAHHINTSSGLRSISFDVKLQIGTCVVRAVIVRPEYERTAGHNGQSSDKRG